MRLTLARDRLLLHITDEGLAVWRRSSGQLARVDFFRAHDSEDQARFASFTEANRSFPVRVLVDLVEEEFQCATLPHVRGRARDAMVARNLQRLHGGTPYRRCDVLGRETGGRRDDLVLYSAITRPDLPDQWLKPASRHLLPVCSLYSPAHLAVRIAQRLGLIAQNTLLVCEQRTGLRQIFLQDGRMRFSRLVVVRESCRAALAEAILAEIERAHTWLLNNRMLARDAALDVVVLAGSSALKALDDPSSAEGRRYTLVEPDAAQTAANCARTDDDLPVGDLLFLDALAKAGAGGYPLAEPERRVRRLQQARQAMFAACAVIGAAGLLATGANVLELRALRQEAGSLAALAASLEARSLELRAGAPDAGVPPSVMRSVVEVQQRVSQDGPAMDYLLYVLARALDRMQAIDLLGLEYEAAIADADGRTADPAGVEMEQDDPGSAALLGLVEPVGSRLRIEARVRIAERSYRDTVGTVRAFAALLAAAERVRVLRVEEPIDLAPEGRLRIERTIDARERGQFAILVEHLPEPRP